MANKNDLFDFDETTAANNDNVQGANIAENCAPSGINNAIRGLAAIVKRAVGSQGGAIASAATTPIGAAGTALYATITGTTTITSFGSVAAGTLRIVEFTGALTLTHNATALKLPGSANITTAAGDIAFVISLGSGNWKCLHYGKADGSPVSLGSGGSLTLTSTDAGATDGPVVNLDRNSASPAANDEIGQINFFGRDSGSNSTNYGSLDCIIIDPTDTSEDGNVRLVAVVNGAPTAALQAANGVLIGSPAGGFKGTGTLNASNLHVAGDRIIPQINRYYDEYAANAALSTTIPLDDTVPTSSEGTQILTRSVMTTSNTQRVRVRVNGFGEQTTSGAAMIMALFRGTTCVQVSVFDPGAGLYVESRCISLEYEEQPGVAGNYTYSVRVGASSGNMRMNGTESARLFGGAAKTTMVIEVFEP